MDEEFDEIVHDIIKQREHKNIIKNIESMTQISYIGPAYFNLYDIQKELIKFLCTNWNNSRKFVYYPLDNQAFLLY